MVEFVLKNNFNYFEFNGHVKQQISGTANDTKFAVHMLVFLWMTLKVNFFKLNRYNP